MSPQTLAATESRAALNQAEALESLLTRLELAARQQRDPQEFYSLLLHDLVGALSAQSAAVWSESAQGLVCLQRVGGGTRSSDQLSNSCEQQLAAGAILSGDSILVAPGESLPGESVANDSNCLQCLVSRKIEGAPGLVLRVGLRAEASLGLRETASGLLNAVAEIALSFQIQQCLLSLNQQQQTWQGINAAILATNATTRLKDCARTIAEQVRCLTQSDRVSLLQRRGANCRLLAISSAADADRRSRQVRLLERLATEAVRAQRPFELRVGDGPEQFQPTEAAEAYLDETQLRVVRCDLLTTDESPGAAPLGCLIVEGYTAEGSPHWEGPIQAFLPHASRAIDRATRLQNQGWRRLLSPFGGLSRTALWLSLLVGLIAGGTALVVIPTDFTIEAQGRLMPVQRRGIFAPADAIVTETLVSDGSPVTAGQALVLLTSPELDQELSRLTGELQTATARLDAIQARRKLQLRDRNVDSSLLSFEDEELRATVAGLKRQVEITREQQQRLSLSSPIDGRVSRWDLAEVLHSLPVRHGQMLMDVYDPNGPWRLELEVPDHVAGYVRLAEQAGRPEVDYLFQSDPGHVLRGKLSSFADATELNGESKLTVRGLVDLPAEGHASQQRGASVVARIHCGRRSLGFVWFREAIEYLHRRILF